MVGLNQQSGPPNQPRPFMGPRQPFGQQGNLFPPPQVQFGMQGLMHGPPVSQLPHHDPLSSHQPMHHHQQHHRQELPHHQQQQLNLSEPRPMMHHGQNPFHQQQPHGSPRLMTPRPPNPQQRNMSNRQRMNTPVSKQIQQRNSNLRELPVAPGNTNMNSARPAASPAANVRPVARATQGVRPGQNTQPVPGGGRGRGQVAAKTELQPGGAGRTVVRKEIASTPSSTAPQDPDEDEETRQYRMKIEEQKRLREEILKRKEMRRQMQAGTLTPRPNVKTRLHMVKGNTPQQQTPGPIPDQQWKTPQTAQNPQQLQQQQRRSSAVQNLNRPGTQIQSTQNNIPLTPSLGPGQAQAQSQGPKPGAKRTVMQRAKNAGVEGQQVPQKVRVVKLSGASGKGPEATGSPMQQQGNWSAPVLNQAVQRKVTMTGQQQQGPGGTPQACRGGMGNPQQNRVVVSGRGRGRGGGQMGRGRPMSTRQSQRGAESERCTVSIEGLSSSTTDIQLKNLLRSIGPIEHLGVPVHSVALCTGLRLGTEKQRGHPVGEPDRCQGPVRQVVVFDHCVTRRVDLVHDNGPLHGHWSKGALVLLRVNPFYGHGSESTSLGVEGEHLLSGLDLAGKDCRHPLLRLVLRAVGVADEEEVRGGEGDFLARVGFDHVEEPLGRRVLIYEHDEVAVNQVSILIRCQHLVACLEVFDRLLGAILKDDGGGAWEAAA
ncbi:hypothetical protein INR49_014887 [Caranx melampygus]|nr:hypothetical protein INR49_014887 [Caranx melampygus]